jgi:hypothetical protein
MLKRYVERIEASMGYRRHQATASSSADHRRCSGRGLYTRSVGS